MEKRTKESSKRINSLILLIAFTAVMLIVSTYAWFTSQRDITLSNLRGTVEVAENMEISLDARTWHQEIDLKDAETVLTSAYNERHNINNAAAAPIIPNELFPVSGIGEVGGTTMPLLEGEATSTSLNAISICPEPDDDNRGYIAFDMYIKNTSKDGEDDVLQLNLNSAVQVLFGGGQALPGQYNEIVKKNVTVGTNTIQREYKGDAKSGLQNTVRVALALYEDPVTSTSTQAEILNATSGKNITKVAIWEPNAKYHVDTIVANNNKLTNGNTPLGEFSNNQTLDTYALKSAAAGQTLTNVYDISQATLLGKQVTLQTAMREDDPDVGLDYRILPHDPGDGSEKPHDLKDTSGNPFTITSNTVSRFRVYIWLEGQDIDCINVASQGGGIEVDLGLTKDNDIGDVLDAATN